MKTTPAPGTVVRWRTARTAGVGQYARTDPDGTVIVRAWLPTPSKEVRTTLELLVMLEDLNEITQGAIRTAVHIAAGLR